MIWLVGGILITQIMTVVLLIILVATIQNQSDDDPLGLYDNG